MKTRQIILPFALAVFAGSAFAAPPATSTQEKPAAAKVAPAKPSTNKKVATKCVERSKLGKCLKREEAPALK